MFKKINLATYPRKNTYEAFLHHDIPVLSTCCELDMTALYDFRQTHGLRLFPLLAFVIDQTVNGVEALRHRIVEGELYEYTAVHPSYTTLLPDNTLSFCDALHSDDARRFYDHIVALSDQMHQHPDVEMREKYGRYFVSNIPWLRFSAFNHPYRAEYACIPVVTTGKFHKEDGRVRMPVALQVHHSLADGYHVGQFYSLLEENFKNAPELLRCILTH